MFFPTFIEPIDYNCRDNRNKLVFYHRGGQIKKILKKNLQSIEKLLSEKNSFYKESSKMIFITSRVTGFL